MEIGSTVTLIYEPAREGVIQAQQHRDHLLPRAGMREGERLAVHRRRAVEGDAREHHLGLGHAQGIDLVLHHFPVEIAHLAGHQPDEEVEVGSHVGHVDVGTIPLLTKPLLTSRPRRMAYTRRRAAKSVHTIS